jgi:DNA polymerase I
MHGAGSLTKYWAYGEKGLKLRGIEARQHSTCKWVKNLQNMALQILIDCVGQGINLASKQVPNMISAMLHEQLNSLNNSGVKLADLVVSRRVTKTLDQFTTSTLTHSALLRADSLGHQILPGRKARFVVVKPANNHPMNRVILVEEIATTNGVKIDYQYYHDLAVRATWAILAPFGWSDEEIKVGSKTTTLLDFMTTQ